MVLSAQIVFAAACTLTKLSMLMFVRRVLSTSTLLWRRITWFAIIVVSVQGTVFIITVIFQCRWVLKLSTTHFMPLTLNTDRLKITGRSHNSHRKIVSMKQARFSLQVLSTHWQTSSWFSCQFVPYGLFSSGPDKHSLLYYSSAVDLSHVPPELFVPTSLTRCLKPTTKYGLPTQYG